MRLFSYLHPLVLLALAACTRDATPTGSNGGPPVRIQPESLLIWRDSQVASLTRPVFDSHAVYFLGVHTAYGVDKTTGASLWTTQLTYPFDPGILQGYGTAIAAGLVIMGDIDVFGLNPQSGAIVWRFAPRQTFPQEREFQRLTTDGTTVYCGGVWGNVYAVDAATGVQRWIAHVTTLPDSVVRVFNPVLANGVVYVAFTDDRPSFSTPATGGAGGVAAIDAGTGRLLWSTYLPYLGGNNTTEARNVVVTSTRVITGTNNGFVFGLDPQVGAILDTVQQSAGIYSLAAFDTVVVVGAAVGVVALDARNLKRKLWTATLNEGGVADLTVDSTRVYTAYFGGQFGITDLATGKVVWWIERTDLRPAGEFIIAGPGVDGTRIYVGADQDVYAFKWR